MTRQRALSFVMIGDEPVEQAHAIAGRALGIGRAVLVVPGHARDIEMRPGDALVHETLEELCRGDRPGLARADILDVGARTVERQTVVYGKSVSGRVDLGVSRNI